MGLIAEMRTLLSEDDLSRAGLKMDVKDGTVSITGKTFKVKGYLGDMGFKFNPQTKAWFRMVKGLDVQQFLAGLLP